MDMPIADILMLHLTQDIVMDNSNTIKTHMFCMDIDKVSKKIDISLPRGIFVDQFVSDVVETYGYKGFSTFCEIDLDGVRDLGDKAYELLI